MKNFWLLSCILCIIPSIFWGGAEDLEISGSYYCPAEFEPIEFVGIAFMPRSAKRGLEYGNVQLEVIKCLAPNEISVYFQNEADLYIFQSIAKENRLNISHCKLFVFPFETIWFRDTTPSFLRGNGEFTLQKAVIFGFDEWGYGSRFIDESMISLDREVGKRIAEQFELDYELSSLISEGGNHEVNGEGVLICVPSLSKIEVEDKLKEALQIEKVIWLPLGLVEDNPADFGLLPNEDGVPYYFTPFPPGGHVDEFCRFVDPQTIFISEVDVNKSILHPIEIENAKRLQKAYEVLEGATDLHGRPFKIVKIPSADLMFDTFNEGDEFYEFFKSSRFHPTEAFPEGRFPDQTFYPFVVSTSYLNFLICNDCVIVPKYWRSGRPDSMRQKDQEVEKLFKQYFPNKRVHMVDVYSLNIGGGGIHCMTHYRPLR